MIGSKLSNYTFSGKRAGEIPSYLVHEVLDGEAVYYKGYREVLAGAKTVEEIMGSSTLQAVIIEYLLRIFFRNFDERKFRIITNEGGLHLDKKNNLAGDIQLFDAAAFPVKAADRHYAAIPPLVHLEVDVNTEMERLSEQEYIVKKTEKLLHFGVGRVIWILSSSRKVLVAGPGGGWQETDWSEEAAVTEGIHFNIGAYLMEHGSPYA